MTADRAIAAGRVTEEVSGAGNSSIEGFFEPESRRQAIAESLPLLATYFAAGQTWELKTQPAIGTANEELDLELAQAVRLRILLALGRELQPILHSLVDQPSFRYGRRDE